MEALRIRARYRRVQALGARSRRPRRPTGENRPVNADAPLSAARGRPDHWRTPLGHPDQRGTVATLLPGGPIGIGGVLRGRSRRYSRHPRTQRRPVRARSRRAPPLAERVRAPLPSGRIPSHPHGSSHVPSACARGGPVLRTAGSDGSLESGVRPRLPGLGAGHRRCGTGGVVARRARRHAHAPLSSVVHPLRRRPRVAARSRRTVRRLRTPDEGARRRTDAEGSQGCLLRHRHALLVRDRRSRHGHRSGRPVNWPAALQRRPVRPRTYASADQTGHDRPHSAR